MVSYLFSAWDQINDSGLMDACAGFACIALVVLVVKMIFQRSGN